MEKFDVEKPDDLEITCIGYLYQGIWEKKYWSSSRRKDRYPYPIGYNAVRTHAGNTYRMEVREGLKGPLFVITSMDGESCSGQTPDIAWEIFQKKSGPRVKVWHGKRYSCKIDGVELFGFRNLLVQRLLRELVANVNGIAEQSLMSTNFCNGASRLEDEIPCPNSYTYPDLLPYLGKQQSTGKRSRKHKKATRNAIGGTDAKRLRTYDLMNDAKNSVARKADQSIISRGLNLRYLNAVAVNLPHFSTKEKLLQLTRSSNVNFEGDESSKTAKGSHQEILTLTGFVSGKDLNCYIPDAWDTLQGTLKTDDSQLVGQDPSNKLKRECAQCPWQAVSAPGTIPQEIPCPFTRALDTVLCEGSMTDLHPEEEIGSSGTSNSSSQRGGSDSVGQDLAKSMMTVLLPQALPLLRKTSKKKKKRVRASCGATSYTNHEASFNLAGDETYSLPDEISRGMLADGMATGECNVDKEPKIHASGKVLAPDGMPEAKKIDESVDGCIAHIPLTEVGSFEGVKSVIPDSFEDDQYLDNVTNFKVLDSHCCDADQTAVDMEVCDCDIMRLLDNGGGKEFLNCHSGNEDGSQICCGVGDMLHQRLLDEGENLIPVSPVGCATSDEFVPPGEINQICDNEVGKKVKSSLNVGLKIVPSYFSVVTTDQDPITVTHSDAHHPHVESILDSKIQKLSLTYEPPNSHGFRRNKIEAIPNLVASLPDWEHIEQAMLPSASTKNSGNGNDEFPDTALVQSHWAHCLTDKKFRSTNSQCHQVNFDVHRLSLVADESGKAANLKGEVGAIHVPVLQIEFDGKAEVAERETVCYPFQLQDEVASTENDTLVSHRIGECPCSPCLSGEYDGPLSQSIVCRNISNNVVPKTYSVKFTHAIEIDQASGEDSLSRKIPFVDKIELSRQNYCLNRRKRVSKSEDLFNQSPLVFQNQAMVANTADDMHASAFANPSVANRNGFHVQGATANLNLNSSSISIGNGCKNLLSHSKLKQKSLVPDDSFLNVAKPNDQLDGFVELFGCYLHPIPVLSISLSGKEDDLHIRVLCGLLEDMERTLFIYKIPSSELRGKSPSFIGYTMMMLPLSHGTSDRRTVVERSGLEFTPDGHFLVLLNSIKAPCCREQNLDCMCSLCTSDCCEENAVKVVHVELGYVSLVSKLTTVAAVQYILVCEPSFVVAVEGTGVLHVWIMNSTWSAVIEEFSLPTIDYACAPILELKRIPKCASIVVGCNGSGDIGLWDICKRILLARFSAPGTSIFHILPVGLFNWQKYPVMVSSKMEDHIPDIMNATEKWFSEAGENHVFLPPSREDIAVWLLVSDFSNSEAQLNHHVEDHYRSPVGCWRLALLVKNMAIMGNILDPRATAAGITTGCGIIGTTDGLVYMWSLSTGIKLADLYYFKSGDVSCIAADAKSGTVAVAGDEGQLLIYSQSSKALRNN